MKKLFILLLLCAATAAYAEDVFPGIKVVLTPDEIKRSGLDRLTPAQIALIDTALVRHYGRTMQTVAAHPAAAEAGQADDSERGWMSRFGLPDPHDDYREKDGVSGRCTAWVGGNSFRLDNGQIWEGLESINFELLGKDIRIEPRPGGLYNLFVDNKNTTVRVRRLK